VLPVHLKKQVCKKFESFQATCKIPEINESLEYIKNYMLSADNSHRIPELKSYLNKTDIYRGQSFANSYPHFKDL
jgi:predicted nucleotidyltransferase